MSSRLLLLASPWFLLTVSAYGADACDKTRQEYRDTARLVDSLRPEKPGQMRVFAADESEFNAGQALWMKSQLRRISSLCARGDAANRREAAKRLAEVQELLKSHHRSS